MLNEVLIKSSEIELSLEIQNTYFNASETYEEEMKKYAMKMFNTCVLHEEKKIEKEKLKTSGDATIFLKI